MDNAMLELFARLLSSQQNISGNNLNNPHENSSKNQNSYYQNSAFNNYPREAFIQNVNNSNLNQSQQPNNTPFGQHGLSTLGNLLHNTPTSPFNSWQRRWRRAWRNNGSIDTKTD